MSDRDFFCGLYRREYESMLCMAFQATSKFVSFNIACIHGLCSEH